MAHTHPHRLALLALLSMHALALAQPTEEDELAQVFGDSASLSLATGSVQALRRAPAVASVVTARDIEAMGATDLDQVLATLPGLHVNRTANHYSALYVVRGVVSQFTPQVLVLHNGVPITTLYHGNKGNLWGGYPLEHVARIEVLRGPGSALYGSDAFSGVINIITKAAADTPGTSIGARSGSFASRAAWVQHGGQLGALSVAAYLGVARTSGFRSVVEADAQSRNDTLFGTHASQAPGPVNTGADSVDANLELNLDKWRLHAGYKLRDKLGTGAGIASALDPVGQGRSERVMADLTWTDPQWAPDWSAGATASILYYMQLTPTDYQLFPPGLRFPTGPFPQGMNGGPDTWERQLRLSAYATYNGMAGHQWRVGAGHDDLNLYRTHETRNFTYTRGGTPVPQPGVVDFSDSNPFLFPQRRRIDYLYLQDEWRLLRDWTLTAGVRHDVYSDFGDTTNPRLALVWDAAHNLTAKLLYGRAFRAPSFIEAYGITNPVALGNRALVPETVGTTEAVLAWQASDTLLWTTNLYRYRMANIIRTVPNPQAGTGATYQNTGSQNGHGAELEAVWSATRRLRVVANASAQRSLDAATQADAGYGPQRQAYVRTDWQQENGILLSVQVSRTGERRRAAGDARPALAGYATVDLSASGTLAPGWQARVALRNALQADVREPSLAPGLALPHDLPMAPRALSIQLSYSM